MTTTTNQTPNLTLPATPAFLVANPPTATQASLAPISSYVLPSMLGSAPATPTIASPAYGPTDMVHWDTKNITYSEDAGIDAASRAIINQAFAYWSQYYGLHFTDVTGSATGNINFSWGNLANGQYGQTSWLQNAGDRPSFISASVTLEDPSIHDFQPGTTTYQGSATNLLEAAAHEIGHAIGLGDSQDPSAIMYAGSPSAQTMLTFSNGVPGNTFVGNANDGLPLLVLYGDAGSSTHNDATLPPVIGYAGNESAVYRFFDTQTGTHFLTTDVTERDSIIQSNPRYSYEGLGMTSVAHATNDPNVAPVYRFFDTNNGTHFFTTDSNEAATVAATRKDMVQEQSTIYEHVTPQTGDTAVYRFFDSTDGSHFYTTSATEAADISHTRPDMVAEGIAFYSPHS